MLRTTESAPIVADGVVRIFTLPRPYVSGTVHHFYNGQLKFAPNEDGLVELPGLVQVELKIVPLAGAQIMFLYDDGANIVYRDVLQVRGTILSTLPGRTHIKIAKASDLTVQMQITGADLTTAFDLTGTKIVGSVRKAEYGPDATPLAEFSTDDPNMAQITDAIQGKLEFYIHSTDLTAVPFGFYTIDVFVFMADGVTKYRVYRDLFEIVP